ncbi:hypothetical protein [Bacillus toyonensis]|uniref:hypothetical protein n=1 Tax=Bacillus toyonensis TaxID=155322 RepID=UPI000BF43B56|nr:hypothetical protein [Bacillus toyonensis]PGF05156.1 hypothetical protein COM61_01665 [Bacillus toyonensis]
MSKESKRAIYDVYNRAWFSNPTIRALGYNEDRFCTGLATTPKELIPLLNNKQCVGVVFLTSPVDFEEYHKNTGQKLQISKFINGEEFLHYSYRDYANAMMEWGLDISDKEDLYKYDKRLEGNSLFLDSLINYGFKSNIDVEPFAMRVEGGAQFPLRTVYLTRGNLTFCVTSEQVAIKVGVDDFMIVHDATRDIDFKLLVDIMSKGLGLSYSELQTELIKAIELSDI